MRILFIEDDGVGREVSLYNLRKAGYEVTPASDGKEGVSVFSREKFDLVVTDLRMPGLSGFEVLQRIRSSAPDIPVIVVTAFGDLETAVEVMRSGACYFLMKPFSWEHLRLAVQQALGGCHLDSMAREVQVPPDEIEQGIVCVFPQAGGALRLRAE